MIYGFFKNSIKPIYCGISLLISQKCVARTSWMRGSNLVDAWLEPRGVWLEPRVCVARTSCVCGSNLVCVWLEPRVCVAIKADLVGLSLF